MTNREDQLNDLCRSTTTVDLLVVGGGANGAGIALDAATRGLKVALCERHDFASGTSSRSSKLIHGGVRYLGLGQFGLVQEALAEQQRLIKNAPALVKPLRFVLPAYSYFDAAKFRIGLKLYDYLAGSRKLESSCWLNRDEMARSAATMKSTGLIGGVAYADAQFDDAQLIQVILEKARSYGAITLNYSEVVGFKHNQRGQICGALVRESGAGSMREFELGAKVVINATGPYGDSVRRLDDATVSTNLKPSQGAHVVVDARFGALEQALVLPRTADGRIMFAIPWHQHLLLGTTETATTATPAHPRALAQEVDDILNVANNFLDPAPTRADVLSVFAGLRPLVGASDNTASSKRSREHAFATSHSGLITVSGGKWTTYRLIAEQAVDLAIRHAGLKSAPCTTATLALAPRQTGDAAAFATWGDNASAVQALAATDPSLAAPLHPRLNDCGAQFIWAARHEFCRSVSDALCFHSRAMFIDAAAAASIAPQVASLMAAELGSDQRWIDDQVAAAKQTAQRFSLELATGTGS